MFCEYKSRKDFVGMDMARKFLEMGFTRARRYANHSSGLKYGETGSLLPIESDCLTNQKAKAAQIFKKVRDKAAYDPEYQQQRKQWRSDESTYATRVDALATTSNVTRSRYSRKRTNVSR